MKFVILIAFIGILGALAAAGFFMLRKGRGDRRSPNMARALAVRVGVSVALFLIILLCWWMGWIQPTGVPLNR
ncbi:MAG: twin transmembrane helix small protein [Rubrivivax sp.]|nr:MAG: twin transmembrane helix small protein [Rubrivivax sp.]